MSTSDFTATVSYHGGNESGAFEDIAEKIRLNTAEVLSRSREEKINPRYAAMEIAGERVKTAISFRA